MPKEKSKLRERVDEGRRQALRSIKRGPNKPYQMLPEELIDKITSEASFPSISIPPERDKKLYTERRKALEDQAIDKTAEPSDQEFEFQKRQLKRAYYHMLFPSVRQFSGTFGSSDYRGPPEIDIPYARRPDYHEHTDEELFEAMQDSRVRDRHWDVTRLGTDNYHYQASPWTSYTNQGWRSKRK